MSTTTIHPRPLSTDSLIGTKVNNPQGENLGEIKEIMLDAEHGRIAYAVLSFGGFLGMGDKLFALPWSTLQLDRENECAILSIEKETLKRIEGFDKDSWPNFADLSFHARTYDQFGQPHYWA